MKVQTSSTGFQNVWVIIRPIRDDEARLFLEIQRAAVRGLAVNDYSASMIEEWAPLPVTDAAIAVFRVNQDDEIRLIAELDGELVGIGALVLVAEAVLAEQAVHGRPSH